MASLALISTTALTAPAFAADLVWTGTTDSDWFTASNWSPSAVPTSSDTLIIDVVNPAGISVGAAASAAITIGDHATATLGIEAGATLTSTSGIIARHSGSTGTVTVTGPDSMWGLGTDQLIVGYSGSGTLGIEAGGSVSSGDGVIGSSADSTGTATVTGTGSTWTLGAGTLSVGLSGSGALIVADAGTVIAGQILKGGSAQGGTISLNGGTLKAGADQADFLSGFASGDIILVAGGGTIDTDTYSVGISAGMSGAGGLTKAGAGTLTLTGANTYDGATTVSAGTLSIAAGGSVTGAVGFIALASGSTGAMVVTGSGSTWDVGSGWLTVGIEGSGTLTIAAGGAVTSTGSGSIGDQAGSTGTVTVNGASSTWNLGAGVLTVGNAGTGTLTIAAGGAVTSGEANIGFQADSTGTVTVTGATSSWSLGLEGLYVGFLGTGTLLISDGGTVSGAWGSIGALSGSTGTVTVTGANSAWSLGSAGLSVGNEDSGTLMISDGGTVTSGFGSIGYRSGSTGAVTVTGAGSTWNLGTAYFYIGFYSDATGTLTISDGGTVTSGFGNVGINAGATGTVTVTGPGSSWNLGAAELYVGNAGTGILNIEAGGAVTSGTAFLGIDTGATGTATVTGTNSTWNLGLFGLYVGLSGSGALTVADGGTLIAGHIVRGGSAQGGTLTLNGGTLKATGDQADFLAGFASGDVTLAAGGGTIDTATYDVGISAVLSGSGGLTKAGTGTLTLSVANTFTGLTTVSAGTLALTGSVVGALSVETGATLTGTGSVAGTVTIKDGATFAGTSGSTFTVGGNLVQQASSMFDLTLVAPNTSPVFGVTGDLTLGGTLNLTAGAGFGVGTYGLITYMGSLTNTTLAIGTAPLHALYRVDTATDTLVSLVVEAGQWWNGSTTSADSSIHGGSGTWNVAAAPTNWTDEGGSTAVAWSQNGLAIFAGDAGTVTVAGATAPQVGGMEFLITGYTVTGGAIVLTAASAGTAPTMMTDTGVTATIASVLTGTDGLDKTGAGTLILTGANTFSGATTVSAGTLALSGGSSLSDTARLTVALGATLELTDADESVGSLAGAGAVNLNAYCLTAGGDGTSTTFSGAISGSGCLTKTGAGTLTLTGTNSFSGGLTVEDGAITPGAAGALGTGMLTLKGAGTVQAIDTFTLTNAITLTQVAGAGGGTFEVDPTKTLTLSGVISGNGTLTKTGTGTLTLSGANSYSGGTAISAGTLEIASAGNLGSGALALSGAGTLKASGTFALSQAVSLTAVSGSGGGTIEVAQVDTDRTLTLSGVVSGDGALTKTGAGTLVLTGTNTYTGGTTISAGTLQLGNGGTTGSILGDVVNNATLVFNRSDSFAFTGAITGSGDVVFTGGGTVSFSAPYSGPVTVNGASVTLVAGTVSGSPFTVGNGYLGGTGTIGALTMNAGGTVSPGYSPGTLTVSGPVTFNAGAVYRVDVTPDGAHDLIVASGTVTLSNGAQVQVAAVPGRYPASQQVAILTTSGTLTGTFGSVSSDYAFLTPQLSYDAHNVYLFLAYTGIAFVEYAQNANQANVAVAAQALGTGNPVFEALMNLPTGAVAPALSQLTGEAYASAGTVMMDQALYLREAVGARLRQGMPQGAQGSALSYAAKAAGPATAQFSADWTPTLWMQGYGGWGNGFSNGNAATVSSTIGGFFAGLDAMIADQVRMGVVGGFSQSQFDVTDRNSSGSIDNYDVGFYAGGRVGSIDLKGAVSYTWHDLSASRSIVFPGFMGATSAGYTQGTTQVFGEMSTQVRLGAYEFEPFLGLAYVNLSSGSGMESVRTPAALAVNVEGMDTVYTTLGARVATTVEVGGRTLTPSATLGWQHAFGDTAPVSTMRFVGGSVPFTIEGVPIAQDAAILGAGLSYALSDRASLQVNYLGQIAAAAANTAFSAQFAVRF